jgi:hypothetical protein
MKQSGTTRRTQAVPSFFLTLLGAFSLAPRTRRLVLIVGAAGLLRLAILCYRLARVTRDGWTKVTGPFPLNEQ